MCLATNFWGIAKVNHMHSSDLLCLPWTCFDSKPLCFSLSHTSTSGSKQTRLWEKDRWIRSTHSLCCALSGSSWQRPVWLGRWNSAHGRQCLRSTRVSCCEAQSHFPSFYSGTLPTSRHIPVVNWQNISQWASTKSNKILPTCLVWFS